MNILIEDSSPGAQSESVTRLRMADSHVPAMHPVSRGSNPSTDLLAVAPAIQQDKKPASQTPSRQVERPSFEISGEGSASLDCHITVGTTTEVIELADSRPGQVDQTSVRGRAFLRLADSHLDAAYRLARAILRDPGEAEDATHDAFLQAWGKWSTLRDPGRFEQWFDRILVNSCRNRLRHASRWHATDISAEVAIATGDPFGQAQDRDVIGAALATLSADHRVVVALRYYRDLSIDEIASRLAIPAGTVQSRLHYALERLHLAIDTADAKGALR